MRLEEEEKAAQWLKETQKGYLRIAVLILLSRKPYHGYEMMSETKEHGLLEANRWGHLPDTSKLRRIKIHRVRMSPSREEKTKNV